MKTLIKHTLALLSLVLLTATGLQAQERTEITQQIEEINQILQENPGIVPDLLASLHSYLENRQQSQQALQTHHNWLYQNDATHPWMGASNPELTLVVFTDYDCPYCKRLDPHLQKLVQEYPQVKVISVLVPLRQQELAGSPVNSAEFGLNVWHDNPSSYPQVENLMYRKNGLHDANSLRQVAQRSETSALIKPNTQVKQAIDKNYRAFTELGLRGTPAILIGEGVIPGYVEYDQLEEIVRSQL